MLEGGLEILPFAAVWHLGLYRNEETFQPCQYYNKMKEDSVKEADCVFILDPMLATGGSITAAVKTLKDKGAKQIKVK
jgi:uracil phosphoribosyltransferase